MTRRSLVPLVIGLSAGLGVPAAVTASTTEPPTTAAEVTTVCDSSTEATATADTTQADDPSSDTTALEVATTSAAGSPTSSSAADSTVAGSTQLVDDELAFQITFPGPFTTDAREATARDGWVYQRTSRILSEGGVVVAYTSRGGPGLPGDSLVDVVRTQIAPELGGTVATCGPITVDGHAGIEYVITIPPATNQVGRVFYVNATTYHLMYRGRIGSDLLRTTGPAFLGSFHFTGELADGGPHATEVPFTDPKGWYTVVFPSTPSERQMQADDRHGNPWTRSLSLSTVGPRVYGVANIGLPGSRFDPDAAVGRMVEQSAGSEARLESSEPVTLQGRRGVRYSMSLVRGGVDWRMVGWVYGDGEHGWNIYVAGPAPLSLDDADVAGFGESFTFTEDG